MATYRNKVTLDNINKTIIDKYNDMIRDKKFKVEYSYEIKDTATNITLKIYASELSSLEIENGDPTPAIYAHIDSNGDAHIDFFNVGFFHSEQQNIFILEKVNSLLANKGIGYLLMIIFMEICNALSIDTIMLDDMSNRIDGKQPLYANFGFTNPNGDEEWVFDLTTGRKSSNIQILKRKMTMKPKSLFTPIGKSRATARARRTRGRRRARGGAGSRKNKKSRKHKKSNKHRKSRKSKTRKSKSRKSKTRKSKSRSSTRHRKR